MTVEQHVKEEIEGAAGVSAEPAIAPPRTVERRSVDWVPNEERTGKVPHLGFIWFAGNINLTAMATGVTALAFGGSLFWTIVATVLGSLFGTFFMAFHSAQGPQLGLPQLVQSRPQFGYVGAALTVWVFALANYIAYNTSDRSCRARRWTRWSGSPRTSGSRSPPSLPARSRSTAITGSTASFAGSPGR